MAGERASRTTRPQCNGDGNSNSEDNINDNGCGNGDGGAIDVYYNAGNVSDNAGVFVAVARVAVDATAAAADQGDDDASCNEDPSVCASPAAAATPSLPVAGAMPQQRTGPPLLGAVTYFSTSWEDKD